MTGEIAGESEKKKAELQQFRECRFPCHNDTSVGGPPMFFWNTTIFDLRNEAFRRQKPNSGHHLDNLAWEIHAVKGAAMNLAELLDPSVNVSSPPPGSVNVRIGKSVEGPGGRWVPCATEISGGVFCSSLFEVGPGRRQVCAANIPLHCADEALSRAIELACSAAA